MWPLIRYQFMNYIRFLVPLSLFLMFYLLQFHQGFPSFKICVFLCFWTFIMTNGALTTSEGYEDKYKGYRILSMLPITIREIIASKFLLLFAAVLLVNLINSCLVYAVAWPPPPGVAGILIMMGVLWGVFCLLYGGLMYLGIFRFGFEKMSRFHWIFFMILVVSLVFFFGEKAESFTHQSLLNLASNPLTYATAGLGLVAYYGIYRYALKVMQRRRGELT